MTITQIPIGPKLGVTIQADSGATSTVVKDLDVGPTWLSSFIFDNNDNVVNYLKGWDNRTPTIGTTGEELIIPCAATSFLFVDFYSGLYFENGFSYAVQTAAGTVSGSAPDPVADVYFTSSAGLAMQRSIGDVLTAKLLRTSITTTTIKSNLGASLLNFDNLSATKTEGATAACTLYIAVLDNRNNPNSKSYLKGYDAAIGDVVVGTTAPELVLFAPKGQRVVYVFPTGVAFSTAATIAGLNTGGTGGTTGPSNAFKIGLYI